MIEASKADLLSPPGSSEEDNAPVNVDAILQSILGRGDERFGMAAAVLRGERIIAQGAAGVRKRGTAERITLDDRFHLASCTKAMTATLVAVYPANIHMALHPERFPKIPAAALWARLPLQGIFGLLTWRGTR